MKTILKAFRERLSAGGMSTRCHQKRSESRSALNFYTNRGTRLLTGTTQLWSQMFVQQPTKLKIEDRHTQTTGSLPYKKKCRENICIRQEQEKLSIKEVTQTPWASRDQGVRPMKCPRWLTTQAMLDSSEIDSREGKWEAAQRFKLKASRSKNR